MVIEVQSFPENQGSIELIGDMMNKKIFVYYQKVMAI